MNNRLETFGLVRSIDQARRRVSVVASTAEEARDGAIIDPLGWDLSTYERNPVVLFAHDDRELPIARTLSSSLSPQALTQVHEFATHPRAEEVWQAVKGRFINAVSVRWLPGETAVRDVGAGANRHKVLVFTKGHQLLETSYVPLPADPGALIVRADGAKFDRAPYLGSRFEPAMAAAIRKATADLTAGIRADTEARRRERLGARR